MFREKYYPARNSPQAFYLICSSFYESTIEKIAQLLFRYPKLLAFFTLFVFYQIYFQVKPHLFLTLTFAILFAFIKTLKSEFPGYALAILTISAFFLLSESADRYNGKYLPGLLSPLIAILPFIIYKIFAVKSIRLKLIFYGLYISFLFFLSRFHETNSLVFMTLNFVLPIRFLILVSLIIFEDQIEEYKLSEIDLYVRLLNPAFVIIVGERKEGLLPLSPNFTLIARGIANVILSNIYFRCVFQLEGMQMHFPYYIKFFFFYPIVFLKVSAISNFFFGIIQIVGGNIKDPHDFPFLAHNPMERWNRWNIYISKFFRSMILIPTFRKTKNLFISVSALFLALGFFHLPTEQTFHFLKDPNAEFFAESFWPIFRVYFMHGIFVYFSLLIPKIFGDKNKKSGWIGVIITYLVLCFIYQFRPF